VLIGIFTVTTLILAMFIVVLQRRHWQCFSPGKFTCFFPVINFLFLVILLAFPPVISLAFAPVILLAFFLSNKSNNPNYPNNSNSLRFTVDFPGKMSVFHASALVTLRFPLENECVPCERLVALRIRIVLIAIVTLLVLVSLITLINLLTPKFPDNC
jgi:hypothetical protein